MKKLVLLIIAATLASSFSQAQSNKEEIEYFQSIFGMEKKAVVASVIKLEGQAKTSFWDLYDEYEAARKEIGKRRIANLNDYVDNYLTLEDEKIDQLVKESISIHNNYNKLIAKYYKLVLKNCGAKAAGQFYQLEGYFLFIVDANIYEQMPIIGELEIED